MKTIEFKSKKPNENKKLLTGTKKQDINLCMYGSVRLIEKCKCGKRIMGKGKLLRCPSCGDPLIIEGYLVDICFRNKRVRIYSDKHGTPLDSPERANRTLEGKELGIKGLTLYQGSRHSIASDAVQRGVSLYDVKDALRHKDIRTTVKYSHLKFEGKRRVITGGDIVKFPGKKEENE